ncbi:hypothetical protein M409DRAFT_63721 [Zasmidium cellare ATCC 36951]|uniref:FAD dependent oxidoreductase domain-containing protein n=1 Tax=Zasmidium cellare ATCC 36951 TaxID=1080233 RepID=A0A6A6CWH1_ZASCE|nr:uncharacterized protein M409DRAFT_63721 [Zasmidium cellare ATCC 36951]KAF2171451.1 hypothetical protein M409DRAFT_63721 [Zasmidium cellare ATCC 36951]
MWKLLLTSRQAVIGAGVSGVSAAVHLKHAGLDVTIFERTSRAGGVWVYDERSSNDAAYPSVTPSVGDSPEFERLYSSYVALKNNVSTIEMELSCQQWKPGTEEFVPHHVLGDYIQDTATNNGVQNSIRYNTRVNSVRKEGDKWQVNVGTLEREGTNARHVEQIEYYDAVVVASGHYHAPNIPDIPGLAAWKRAFPDRVSHSKRYRNPDGFAGQNVLLLGAGVSSIDIAKDIGVSARAVYQSSRGGPYDLPSHLLPDNGVRIGGVEGFSRPDSNVLASDGSIPGTITLKSGEKLCNIHRVVVCTGYHVSLPFLRQLHADDTPVEDADESTLVTNGQAVHNLHQDIWYIPDPTLSFIGVPFHVATFSLFEFQAMALAQVYAGKAPLPTTDVMRDEYLARLQRKGAGRALHSLKGKGEEIAYVEDLVRLVNREGGEKLISGHTQKWLEAYQRRTLRMEAFFSLVRDAEIEKRARELLPQC